MPSAALHDQAASFVKKRPDIRPGFTVRVHERIQEGNKERVQVFEGLVIAVHRGHTPADASFTVRRIVSGVGVEKVFALHSPKIEKIEVKKVAKVRRAKLYFLRGRRGKAARLSERFTTAEEFAIAAETPKQQEESSEEASAEEVKEDDQAAGDDKEEEKEAKEDVAEVDKAKDVKKQEKETGEKASSEDQKKEKGSK